MKKFVTNSKNILPVDEKKYLKPFLTSTNINTRYWESPPENNMSDTYLTSKLMQIHQLLDMFKSLDIDFKNKKPPPQFKELKILSNTFCLVDG